MRPYEYSAAQECDENVVVVDSYAVESNAAMMVIAYAAFITH